ncbi:PREDICTED: uncharacterized protein LOC105149760 [Acromyrmex echinatior]|uniref:uncharacterized protein LOC105149760 n=1 Tax=Acromyrmex echinatior TaxID=103372 RepID=UPI000580D1B9|nr:PREDICTED: uncharacterized protein LOC105149760 [Acromyrmex echinatior]
MSTDLLPESVNLFLDDFETSLCLPILVVMVLCTAQFVFNHVFGIGYTIYQNVKKPAMKEKEEDQRMLTTLGIKKPDVVTTNPRRNPGCNIQSREDEWDYCEEDTE